MLVVWAPAVWAQLGGGWWPQAAELGQKEVEVKGSPPRPSLPPSLPQTPGLGMALEQGIWDVVSSFLSPLLIFFSFFFLYLNFKKKIFFRCLPKAAYK